MMFSLAGLWQLSPLTDLTIPQNDLSFPGPLSQCLPDNLSEDAISEQEWHLMHDIEVDEAFLSYPAIDLIIEGVDYYAEVRLNGFALFDCDQNQSVYRKDISSLLNLGRNRFEVLFLNNDEDELLIDDDSDSDDACLLGDLSYQPYDKRMGIWKEPYLQCLKHVRLTHISTEQVWHYGGGCELLVKLHFDLLKAGLISARVKFDGRTYSVPLDMMKRESSALFQIDAPVTCDGCNDCADCTYELDIELDGLTHQILLPLSIENRVSHFPI
ncbi:hypothetical protein OAP63_13705 [Vibrio sp.]|uniref:Beta-mannosidase-like galactose-binding domain-containing protein n=1 Tax=Vibrio viridaestus TaxID=2487322 RepID=A0A3N9TF22_9VIBR|nr:hypothetical protein [Vibrio viridaestus]MDC0611786.1 hypothetical protein [Vibrio sp.]RQW62831.1 hypothetical protein EES38_10860 [Vibrio viridaestus]